MTSQSKKTPDPLAPLPFLSADALRATTFVRRLEIHDTLDSTNNRAAELAHDTQIELPALIVARHQTAGRGRGANKWWSADGALTFSLLIDPATHGITTARWPQLSLTTAVAICDALQPQLSNQRAGSSPTPTNLGIKWPNDVLIDGRKIAGILLESPGGVSPAKDRLILGIGFNVNNSFQPASPNACGVAPTNGTLSLAIALCDVTGNPHDLQQVLAAVLTAAANRIEQLRTNDPNLPRAWQRHSSLTDQIVTVTYSDRKISGRCLGIANDGALLVQSHSTTERIYSGSVSTDKYE